MDAWRIDLTELDVEKMILDTLNHALAYIDSLQLTSLQHLIMVAVIAFLITAMLLNLAVILFIDPVRRAKATQPAHIKSGIYYKFDWLYLKNKPGRYCKYRQREWWAWENP